VTLPLNRKNKVFGMLDTSTINIAILYTSLDSWVLVQMPFGTRLSIPAAFDATGIDNNVQQCLKYTQID